MYCLILPVCTYKHKKITFLDIPVHCNAWIFVYSLPFLDIKYGTHPLIVCHTAISYVHYDDVRMGAIASQITSLTIVYSTVYSDADQRKHQSSASLASVWGIHRDRWIPRTKGQLRGKCFHLMTSSWFRTNSTWQICLMTFLVRPRLCQSCQVSIPWQSVSIQPFCW